MKFRTLFLLFFLSNTCIFSQSLQIRISGVRAASGNIRLAFYSNSQSFDDEKPLFIRKATKTELVRNSMTISYTDLKPGTYGIAILDDENSNDKMDYGWVLPKEGFGFSDYYHSGMTRPKFEQFDFVLDKAGKSVEIKVRYL